MPEEVNLPAETPVDGVDRYCDDALLRALVGEWNLTRKIGARSEQNHVRAEWVLNYQFLQVHMKDVKQPPGYEALVFIGRGETEGRYVIHWIDTFGGTFSEKGTGTRDGSTIQFVFQYPGSLLHNTFTRNLSDNSWSCRIEQQDDSGNWSLFCEDLLTRVSAARDSV